MNSNVHVDLTETTVVVLAKGVCLTSIPLRHWTTADGNTSSGRLRRAYEIEWLIGRFRHAFEFPGDDSVMKRLVRVLSERPPGR